MIRRMALLRIAGPQEDLPGTIELLQDLEVVHLRPWVGNELPSAVPTQTEPRRAEGSRRKHLEAALGDVEAVLAVLERHSRSRNAQAGAEDLQGPEEPAGAVHFGSACLTPGGYAHYARLARRLRPDVEVLADRLAGLEEERALLQQYAPMLESFGPLLRAPLRARRVAAYQVMLAAETSVADLSQELERLLGGRVSLYERRMASGEQVLLLLVPRSETRRMERLFGETGVEEVPLPKGYAAESFAGAAPAILARLRSLPEDIAATADTLASLARSHAEDLRQGRGLLHDALAELDAAPLAARTPRTFVLQGWAPADEVAHIQNVLERGCEGFVLVETVGEEQWPTSDAPVALQNPRLLRPFELLVRLMPLPAYGSIDPTPLIAVFFPLFFGLILGDAGYGLLVFLLAAYLRRRAGGRGSLAAIGEIGMAAGLSAILFGIAFGEAFGNLGRHAGLQPLLFDREHEPVTFLGLAVAIGFVHILLGLGLGVKSTFRHERRHAWASALTAAVLVAGTAAGLAIVLDLGSTFSTAALVGAGVAVVALPVVGGVVALVELLSAVGNVLSYARLMALGTASVMLALVANQMGGSAGMIGLLAALLLHLVNLVLGMFSPTIHSLRLHYVEFFGKFYRPGGEPYRPFGHWRPQPLRTAD